MKIIFFVNKSVNSATARFRGYLFSKKLKESYITKVIKIDEIYNRYEFNFSRLKKLYLNYRYIKNQNQNNIIYLVKTVYNFDFLLIIIFLKFFYKKKIIFDFDDAIYIKPFTKLSTIILTSISDIVIVGSNTLYKWSKKKNIKTYKLPTSIPHEKYKCIKKIKNKIFTIGWIGNGNNHYKNLLILRPIFEELIKKKIKFKFRLIGMANNHKILRLFRSIKGLKFEYKNHINWKNVNSTVKEIKKFDIGVMPLVKDEKTLGKCAFKIIEYMGSGIPVLASPVGENRIVIRHKKDGFLCKDTNDWVKKILKLKVDKTLREKFILNSFTKVEKSYSLDSNIIKLKNILRKIKAK